ncbi:RHS repeat protein, partial [Leifsonia sp. C5G2]|nr:RHS repeat protein [Leifsonia sp. C5G2]
MSAVRPAAGGARCVRWVRRATRCRTMRQTTRLMGGFVVSGVGATRLAAGAECPSVSYLGPELRMTGAGFAAFNYWARSPVNGGSWIPCMLSLDGRRVELTSERGIELRCDAAELVVEITGISSLRLSAGEKRFVLPVGSLTRLDRSTGIRSAYTYDAADRVTAVTHTTPQPSAPPVPVATPTPAPDAKGSAAATACTGVAGYLGSRAAYQLTASETSGRGRGVSAGTASYSYDAAGNRVDQTVAGVSTRFAYNPAGQTTEVAREGRTTSYGYDGLGRNTS